jgi:hypothetical protein
VSARVAVLLAAAWIAGPAPAAAQPTTTSSQTPAPPGRANVVDGHLSVLAASLPNANAPVELRTRLFAERHLEIGRRLTLVLSGGVEGLLANRVEGDTAIVAWPEDLYLDVAAGPFDLRAGLTRIVWGRLDEIQPGDVLNPLDVSRFFLEGRSEARLPVWAVRVRWHPASAVSLEAVAVPWFRRGRFDRLAEETSPFNLERGDSEAPALFMVDRREPVAAWRNVQGGLRLSLTTRRVDWSVSAFRGFEPFGLFGPRLPPVLAVLPDPAVAVLVGFVTRPTLVQQFPRFTMVSWDFETAHGAWAVRAEVAAFLRDSFQSLVPVSIVDGRSVEAGVGIERKTGAYRWSGGILISRQVARPVVDETSVQLVMAGERRFARETRQTRLFAVWNPADRGAFARSITAISLRDDVWLEGSVGWFIGKSDDAIGRFRDRDFLSARLKVYF